jgi:hypothetical protein
MFATILSKLRSYDMFHQIVLLTCKAKCCFCGAINKHGFGSKETIVNESRGCDTCFKTYILSESPNHP